MTEDGHYITISVRLTDCPPVLLFTLATVGFPHLPNLINHTDKLVPVLVSARLQ